MELNFRQGIVRRQADISNTPIFIQKSALDGRYLDLVVSPDPTIFTIAHFDANYLIEESRTVTKAWGPLEPTGETQYLYWDISILDGALTRNYTLLSPIVSSAEPTNPAEDQHWFDLTTKTMKVFISGKWQIRVRCFAAIYDSNAMLIQYPLGSQANLNNVQCKAGSILLGKNNRPLRDSDGTFVTSESELIVARGASETVKFDAVLVHAESSENIPKYSLVTINENKKLQLASYFNTDHQVHGIVTSDLGPGEVGQVISNGLIRNEQWSFTQTMVGQPLFCGQSGQVTLNPPISGILQQVGFVFDEDSIYLNLFTPVVLTNT